MQRYILAAALAAFFFLPGRAAAQTPPPGRPVPSGIPQGPGPQPPMVIISTLAEGQLPASPTGAQLPVKVEDLSLAAAIAEVLKDDPEAVSGVYQQLVDIYRQQRKPDKAISLLETYRRGGGGSRQLLSLLATLYLNRNALNEAVGVYEALLQLYPGDAQAQAELSTLYPKLGKAAKAAELAEAAAGNGTAGADSFVRLADFYHRNGDLAKAAQAIARAIALAPRPEYYREQAQLLSEQGKPDQALSVLEEAMARWPEAEADLTMAMCGIYVQKGQKEKAVARLNALLSKVQDKFRRDDIQRLIAAFEKETLVPPGFPQPVPQVSTQSAVQLFPQAEVPPAPVH